MPVPKSRSKQFVMHVVMHHRRGKEKKPPRTTRRRSSYEDGITTMKPHPTQFGTRENTASSRQHASRLVLSPSLLESENPPENGATGEARDDATGLAPKLNRPGDQAGIERPLTCEEAAELVRVHPKTVRRMARSGELPGHFRFGRWFFYASELDCWMRTELHLSRHSCR